MQEPPSGAAFYVAVESRYKNFDKRLDDGHTPCSGSPELARNVHWAFRLVRNLRVGHIHRQVAYQNFGGPNELQVNKNRPGKGTGAVPTMLNFVYRLIVDEALMCL